jgi:hypothetical protein
MVPVQLLIGTDRAMIAAPVEGVVDRVAEGDA